MSSTQIDDFLVFLPLVCTVCIVLVFLTENHHHLQALAMHLRRHYLEYATEVALAFVAAGVCSTAYATTGDASCFLTYGAGLRLAGAAFLSVENAPVSVVFVGLQLAVLGLRLFTTVQHNAYLPTDASGDWAYQTLDAATAGLLLAKLRRAQPDNREAAIVGAGLLAQVAFLCHGDLARDSLANFCFALSSYLEPLSWAFQARQVRSSRSGGYYMLFMAAASVCAAHFWRLALPEIRPRDAVGIQWMFPELLVGAHVLTVLLQATCGAFLRVSASVPAVASPPAVELKEPLPAGCTHFEPIGAAVEGGRLVVRYRPVLSGAVEAK